jgi:bifunctional dethiobiotin synthetase / adenosylmethionine---8-amino-7-oxononanoate aminotransferase
MALGEAAAAAAAAAGPAPPPLPLVLQVYGANTDVGKTVVSAGLLRASLLPASDPSSDGDGGSSLCSATYIKPLQTGSVTDEAFVQRHASNSKNDSNGSNGTSKGASVRCRTLFSWGTPVSPHLAAAKEQSSVTDAAVVGRLSEELRALPQGTALALVETAGGVLSPGPSSAASAQADLYRPLRLPVLLVGDGRLGGISATIAAFEALVSRGYDVHAVALLDSRREDEGEELLGNAEAVRKYLSESLGRPEVPVVGLPPLPPPPPPQQQQQQQAANDGTAGLEAWYAQHAGGAFAGLLATLRAREEARRERLAAMPQRAAEVFWYPFTQHRGLGGGHVSVVDSAHGDHYTVLGGPAAAPPQPAGPLQALPLGGERLIDACASWWTQGLGHGRVDVALAVGAAAGRYGHVIFPGNVHEPALRLAELMLAGPGRGWATRVFFSDNGSTAMEIAVKMALKRAAGATEGQGQGQGQGQRVAVVTQQDCYHGDTLGCMDTAAPTVFNTGQHPWYRPRTLSLAVPTIGWVQGQLVVELPPEVTVWTEAATAGGPPIAAVPFPGGMASLLDLPTREKAGAAGQGGVDLAALYQRAIAGQMDAFEQQESQGGGGPQRLAAVLLEPVLMGAAGMILVDPLFQRCLVLEARRRGLPVVFDEVAAGLHRLGYASTAEVLGVTPDIACYGKTLTGGYLPLALTLTTEAVFQAFHGPNKSDALLHGHSYTANPLACAAAVRALEAYADRADSLPGSARGPPAYPEARVAALSRLPGVRRAVALGTVLAAELAEAGDPGGYGSTASARVVQALRRRGVYARPLGNVVYLLASQVAAPETTAALLEALEAALRERGAGEGLEEDAPAEAVVI